jgi:hypothetical protein
MAKKLKKKKRAKKMARTAKKKPAKKSPKKYKLPTIKVGGKVATKCYHCDAFLTQGERFTHNCWTKTEEELTYDLPEELKDAWERLRSTAVEFGDQRIYASHRSIMFSRKSCYFFVRPQKKYLEVCFFLGRRIKDPFVRKVQQTSKTKFAHMVRVHHYDEVEGDFTDWLKEAYDFCPPSLDAKHVEQGARHDSAR